MVDRLRVLSLQGLGHHLALAMLQVHRQVSRFQLGTTLILAAGDRTDYETGTDATEDLM